MALDGYGVLKGKAVDRRREGSSSTPHFQIRVADVAGTDYRIAVNVKSQASPSELLYLVDEDFRHPVTGALETIAAGWHELQSAAEIPDAEAGAETGGDKDGRRQERKQPYESRRVHGQPANA